MWIERSDLGGEEIGLIPAHLMEVHSNQRLDGPHHADEPPDLGLCRPQPIAIKVEEIMVETALGPGLIMLGSESFGDRPGTACGPIALQKPGAAVGILDRDDENDSLIPDPTCPGILSRQKVVGGSQQRIGG